MHFVTQFNAHYINLSKMSLIALFSPFHIHFGLSQISIIKSSVEPMIANKVLCAMKVFFPFNITSRVSTACGVWRLIHAEAAGNLAHAYTTEPFSEMTQVVESRYSLFSCTLFTKALRETEPTVRRVGIRWLFKFEHRARL